MESLNTFMASFRHEKLLCMLYGHKNNSIQIYQLSLFSQESICISRACAGALNFNCAIIVIPMCRTLLSFVRTKLLKVSIENKNISDFELWPRRLIS